MKKLLATLLLGAALAVAALPVSAQGTDGTVTLTADGNAAAVSLALPQEAAQGVTALRLSFEVESSEPVEAEFVFDAALPGTVQQYRYDAASGRLNVYVAGREELLPDGNAALGEVRVESSQASTATVRVVQDSLELVDAALAKSEATTSSNGEVSLTLDGNGGTTPQPSEKPSGGGNSNQGSSSNQTTQSSPAPTTVTATAPTPTAAPTTAGQQPTAQSSSGSKKPTGSKATPAPSATPEPDEETQATATPAPTASPEAATQTATPEQAQPEQTAATGLPMAVIVVIACLAAAVLIGVLVIRFRNR
ncbi:hypothetical protein [uncultured Subdoligranulum sp.]|uniref:hypothetical protein n=1 Tax=uncultured Subdoligranulum sp. TaxID=512298 RepID=UPI0025E96E9E|nr:hypothetical protein [uncultured Subdoligranulum sp.]